MMTSPASQPSFSQDEVAQHNAAGDLWIIIGQEVYDLSGFVDEHPGGSKGMYSSNFYLRSVYLFITFSSPKRSRERRNQELPKVSSGQSSPQVQRETPDRSLSPSYDRKPFS